MTDRKNCCGLGKSRSHSHTTGCWCCTCCAPGFCSGHLSHTSRPPGWPLQVSNDRCTHNRGFPEITGEDNSTMFSYSGRVKSPEWRWQRRRADLRHFEIFRHGPIIIYARLPPGGTYYPICTFPANSECLIGISDAVSAFCLRVIVIFPTCSLYPQQKRAYSALHPQAWTYYIPVSYTHLTLPTNIAV